MLLRLARRLLRAPKTARRGAPASAPGRRKKQPPTAGRRTLSRAERNRKRYAEDEDYRASRLAQNRKWERTHREHVNEYKRLVRNTNPKFREKNRARLANGRRMAKYGLSPEEFARMLARQNGLCANCKIRPAETLCVDHSATKPAWCEACSAASATPGWDASTTARRSCSRPWHTFTGTRREKSVPGSQPGGRSSRISGRCPADRSLAIGYAGAPATRGLRAIHAPAGSEYRHGE